MKKLFSTLLVTALVCFSLAVFADPPTPPADPNAGGGGGGPVGAPIDGGLGILLAMGATYGAKKLYSARKAKKEEEILEQ
jgi:hypothetical protein